jgi:DNA polymerase eta
MACDRLVKMHNLDGPPDAALPPAPPIPWTGNVIPVEDEGHEDGWEDWALFIGGEIMSELRKKVYEQLHYTCSAGIAHGKASAKVSKPGASD